VEVHKHEVDAVAQRGEDAVDVAERLVRGVEEDDPRQVHHPEAQPVRGDDREAPPGVAGRVVGRAHDALLEIEVLVDLLVLEGVVAERYGVHVARVEPAPGDLRGDAEPPGGVLPVNHHEVRRVVLAETREKLLERAPTRAPDHVADEQELHGAALSQALYRCARWPDPPPPAPVAPRRPRRPLVTTTARRSSRPVT